MRVIASILFACALAGCTAKPDYGLLARAEEGDYGRARGYLYNKGFDPSNDRSDEALLDRSRFAIVTLADGLPRAADPTLDEIYGTLRTQGFNADREAVAVLLNEDLKRWKGEPFEQAMLYEYVAIGKAMEGEWGNARAATTEAIRLLDDFRRVEQEVNSSPSESGYVTSRVDVPLLYLTRGVAARALGRPDEAEDNFAEAERQLPELVPVTRDLRTCNTVLIVDYGLGPEKLAGGSDGSRLVFDPRMPSDDAPIVVRTPGGESQAYWAADLNDLSRWYSWNHLESLRVGKSIGGDALLFGGVIAASSDDEAAQWAGLGAMLAGMILKAGAHVDTRFCELMPQRVYVVPLMVYGPGTTVTLEVPTDPASRLTLTDLDSPPDGERLQLRYVRLNTGRSAPSWATSGRVLYANDRHEGFVAGGDLPYILGGRCVRTPSDDVLRDYQASGYLAGFTLAELEGLYRDEGISLELADQWPRPDLHVLEGGRSLVCPLAGTTGYQRLFSSEWPAYEPRSERVRALAQSIASTRSGRSP